MNANLPVHFPLPLRNLYIFFLFSTPPTQPTPPQMQVKFSTSSSNLKKKNTSVVLPKHPKEKLARL